MNLSLDKGFSSLDTKVSKSHFVLSSVTFEIILKGSEGKKLTDATQLAHSVDAQVAEVLCVGVVGQSLNQSSVLAFGSV